MSARVRRGWRGGGRTGRSRGGGGSRWTRWWRGRPPGSRWRCGLHGFSRAGFGSGATRGRGLVPGADGTAARTGRGALGRGGGDRRGGAGGRSGDEPVAGLGAAAGGAGPDQAAGRRGGAGGRPGRAVLLALAARPGFALVCAVHGVSAAVGVATRLRLERAERRRRAAAEARAGRLLAEERARMARELHDAVGHAVTVMVTHAGAARLCLADGPPDVRAALERIERVGRDAMTDLDRVLGLLRPAPPLVHALNALLAGLPPRLSPTLELDDGAAELSDPLAEAVRRIVQESLTNTLKHSTATAAAVRLTTGARAVHLSVTDNGAPAPPRRRRGPARGLASMRHRAAALGGSLTAGPTGDGWRVEVRLPCR
ncbi:histidine kinase [Kitasatospora cheerisanensis KCTC 2395]|uniref:histidine kinase n=1 Tax=Kitasatospora cheerisanensis KCTC 2395 TaxID=1348663 RepID=A0A066YKT9_9ACTN|nr:histidine kinase [Kitasatospora cheerisanensis KCTC 2395]